MIQYTLILRGMKVMYGKRRWKIWCFARKVVSVERIRVYLGYMN